MTNMTTRTGRHPRGRSRPSHASPRKRKGPLWAGLTALAVLGAAGFALMDTTTSGADRTRDTARAEPTGRAASGPGSTASTGSPEADATSEPGSGSESGSGASTHSSRPPRPHRSSGRSTGPSSPPPKTSSEPDIPVEGPGTYTVAAGESAKVGTGTALRYRVEVEDNLDLSAADVARQVDRILADRRGWTRDGHSAFQRVSSGTVDFVVRVATPATVDKKCLEGGLDTLGDYNCSWGDNVMVNLERWLLATPVYAKDVTAYRALIINHEVGHFLRHNHVGCPGPGQPAPAMMQQIKGMNGCVPNVWPYDEQGRYLTGPAVP